MLLVQYAAGAFVYPPYTGDSNTERSGFSLLAVEETKGLGDKAGLCTIARRAGSKWPEFTKSAHPECFVTSTPGTEKAFRQRMKSLEANEVWLFKSLTHNTYGGLSIMFYDRSSGNIEHMRVQTEEKTQKVVRKHEKLQSYRQVSGANESGGDIIIV